MGYDFEAKNNGTIDITILSRDGVSSETHTFHVSKGVKYDMSIKGNMKDEYGNDVDLLMGRE